MQEGGGGRGREGVCGELGSGGQVFYLGAETFTSIGQKEKETKLFMAETGPFGTPFLTPKIPPKKFTQVLVKKGVPARLLAWVLANCFVHEFPKSGGHMTRPPHGGEYRGTSKKLGAFLEVQFSLVLLCFEGRRSSEKFLRGLSLA